MTLNTLFLPLLGGFLFYGLFNGTSHRVSVQPAQILLFWSSAIGLALLVVSRTAVHFLLEVIEQSEPRQTWLVFAVGTPLAYSMLIGCIIWFTTYIVRDAVVSAHKLKAVVGIIVSVLAVAFLFHCALAPDAPQRILDLDHRLYTVGVVAALVGGAYWYAAFGAIPWGGALIRISAGIVLVAAPMYYVIQHQDTLIEFWQALTKPIANSDASVGLGSAFAACILGVVGALLANIVYPRDVAETRYVLGKGPSQLERLFYSAHSCERLILLTMDNGKVYVGTVKRIAIRGNADPYIVILPTISGYRTKDKLTVEFTTFYQRVYKNEPKELWDMFQKVLPMQKIVSAAYYDQRFHDKLSVPLSGPTSSSVGV